MTQRIVPVFKTESEEAQWWYDHRNDVAKDMAKAKTSELGEGVRKRLKRLRDASSAAQHEKAA